MESLLVCAHAKTIVCSLEGGGALALQRMTFFERTHSTWRLESIIDTHVRARAICKDVSALLSTQWPTLREQLISIRTELYLLKWARVRARTRACVQTTIVCLGMSFWLNINIYLFFVASIPRWRWWTPAELSELPHTRPQQLPGCFLPLPQSTHLDWWTKEWLIVLEPHKYQLQHIMYTFLLKP